MRAVRTARQDWETYYVQSRCHEVGNVGGCHEDMLVEATSDTTAIMRTILGTGSPRSSIQAIQSFFICSWASRLFSL